MSDVPPAPSSQARLNAFFLFAAKAVLVALLFVGSAIFLADWVVESLEDSATRTIDRLRETIRVTTSEMPLTGAQFWGRVERELDRAADPQTDLPPAKKQKLMNDLRVITARWRPFVEVVAAGMQKPSAAIDAPAAGCERTSQ